MKNLTKKIAFIALMIVFSITTLTLQSQTYTELWGMTEYGGSIGKGTIFKTDSNGDNQQVMQNFLENYMIYPAYSRMCEADNGKLYGMSSEGGDGYGVIFEYDPTTSETQVKWVFDYYNGHGPKGSLMLATNGKLYGMTSGGGANLKGVIFEFDPNTGIYTNIFDFSGAADGYMPFGSLIQATNGKLYGMTAMGGTNDLGVMFEYDLSTSTFTKKVDFAGASNGKNPYGDLVEADNGKLYGMTNLGGSNDWGVLFEYNPTGSVFTKKKDLNPTDGGGPMGSLMKANNGNLYGMTQSGGVNYLGVLFEYNPASSTFTKKVDFDGSNKGSNPSGSLTQATNGKLYGMTQMGGTNDIGVLFEYDLISSVYSKKVDFAGITNGSRPQGSLAQASNGKMYGMTYLGGTNNLGVFFEYDIVGSSYTKIVDFEGWDNGAFPNGTLLEASNGKLYGTAQNGGINGAGVIFEYDPQTLTYSKIFSFYPFDETTGYTPTESLIQATNGKLYGMTNVGGVNGYGVIFEYDLTTQTFAKKFDFNYNTDGANPYGALVQAPNGHLYGMTYSGGLGAGVLFEYNIMTSTYTTKKVFGSDDGGMRPWGSMIVAENGKLYGMTSNGGANGYGAIFEYDPDTDTYTKKFDFVGIVDGHQPSGSLIQASNGKFYGTANGGTNDKGVIFEFDLATLTYTKKIDFDGTDTGQGPLALMEASNGKLYGMTYSGGANAMGVMFEYDLATSTYVKKLDFNGSNGQNPSFTKLIEICAQPVVNTQPDDTYICPLGNTSFSIVATGNDLTYKWQVNTGTSFEDIEDNAIYAGSESTTLDITGSLTNMNGYEYRCVITSTCPVTSVLSEIAVLHFNPTYEIVTSAQVCQGVLYNWRGLDYDTEGLYYDNYTSTLGCDSTYVLDLVVSTTTLDYFYTAEICEGETYTWRNIDYTEDGEYIVTVVDPVSCDSVFTLNLTVNPLPIVSITGLETQYCLTSPVVLLTGDPIGGIFSGPGVSDDEFTPSVAGIGTWEIVYTYSDGNNCENSASESVVVDACSGIEAEISDNIQVYPNPNSGDFTISLNKSGDYNLAIYNSLGQIVWSQNESLSEQKEFSVSGLVPGAYILKLVSEAKTDVLKIVIR